MKKADKLISELIAKVLREYIFEEEAAGDGNPFAAAAEKEDKGGGKADAETEAPADAGGEEKEEEGDKKKPVEDKGLSFNFDVSGVKKYNTASFRSSSAVAKKITKNGILATVQPDGAEILVGFDDITESVKDFFKNKK